MWEKLFDVITRYVKSGKNDIIKYIIIGALAIICLLAMGKCSAYKTLNADNVAALTDTIAYYKSRSNGLVAQKTMLQGDMDLLKKTNDSLYNKIKDISVKNPDNAVYVSTVIRDERRDTCWIVSVDSVYYNKEIKKEFDFSDSWRTIQGYTYLRSDTLGTRITRNDVTVDFTIVQKDSKVYITSNNPYVEYSNIVGITQEKAAEKVKRWGIGPYIGFGVTHKLDFVPTVGVSLHWSLIRL